MLLAESILCLSKYVGRLSHIFQQAQRDSTPCCSIKLLIRIFNVFLSAYNAQQN